MPTESVPSSNQTSPDRRSAGPPLWTGFNLRTQPTVATPYTYQGSPYKESPSELLGEKTRARVVGQHGLSAVGGHTPSQNIRLNGQMGYGTVPNGDQSAMDDRMLLHPSLQPPKYSKTTRYRWACFLLYIILSCIVLGIAIPIHEASTQGIWEAYPQQKRWKDQRLDDLHKSLPPPEYARLGFWRSIPFIDVIPSGLAIALLWILDVYYPLTWASKPKGQVLYVLSVMIFQCGFAVAWCYITPIACQWIANGSNFDDYHRVFQYSWTVAACLLAQIVILTIVVLLIILTTSQHIRAGRREALDHPLCRYNPSAPRPLRMLTMSQSTLLHSQDATTNTVPLDVHPPRYGFKLISSLPESPAGSEVQTNPQQHRISATGTVPSTVGESESS